ncbi:hypothetical protein QBE52_08765 [Clostridiaceae bacterium 35-E11]
MFILYLRDLLLMLFLVCGFGYLLTIIKEKYYLWHNTICIESKALSQQHVDDIDTKHFILGNVEVMAGDEMKINLYNNSSLKGIILGAKLGDNSLFIITSKDELRAINIQDIKRFKIISKYGKLFKKF